MSLLLMAFFALMYSFINVDVHEQAKFAASVRGGFGVELLEVNESDDPDNSSGSGAYHDNQNSGSPTTVGFRALDYSVDRSGIEKGLGSKFDVIGVGQLKSLLDDALSAEMESGRVKIKVDADDLVVELQSFATSGDEATIKRVSNEGRVLITDDALAVATKVAKLQAIAGRNIKLFKPRLFTSDDRLQERKKNAQETYNTLIKEFDDDIQAEKLDITLREDEVTIRLASVGAFFSGSARLNPKSRLMVGKLGSSLRADAGKIRIEGHTDNIPIIFSERFISNWDLSAARSSSVAAVLIEDSGLKANLLVISGFGETKPLASNDTAEGRSKNRRIDIIIQGKVMAGL